MKLSKKYLIVIVLLTIVFFVFLFSFKRNRWNLLIFQSLQSSLKSKLFQIVTGVSGNKVRLTIRVVDLLDNSVVSGASVEVAHAKGGVISRKSLDDKGIANFDLPPGAYIVRMSSGYTGQAEIDLQFERDLLLKVIPVSR